MVVKRNISEREESPTPSTSAMPLNQPFRCWNLLQSHEHHKLLGTHSFIGTTFGYLQQEVHLLVSGNPKFRPESASSLVLLRTINTFDVAAPGRDKRGNKLPKLQRRVKREQGRKDERSG